VIAFNRALARAVMWNREGMAAIVTTPAL